MIKVIERIEKGTAAIVLAAGSGSRMQSSTKKQYMEVGKKPLVYYALKAFEDSCIETVVLVVSAGDEAYCQKEIVQAYGFRKVASVIAGGKERYHSVFEGLKRLTECQYVLIHDAARPFVTPEIIERALDGARKYQACVIGMPVKDTIKISDDEQNAEFTPPREKVWMVQTPQAFAYPLIKKAYNDLSKKPEMKVTDDAMVVETFTDIQVKLIEGSYYNIKITTPEDLEIAEVFLKHSRGTSLC